MSLHVGDHVHIYLDTGLLCVSMRLCVCVCAMGALRTYIVSR